MKTIKTTPAAIKAMTSDNEAERKAAAKFLASAIGYYCKTDTLYEGMNLQDWIADGDWHFRTDKLPTAKALAAEFDNR